MSRIHEALQRADRERKSAPVSVDIQIAEPNFAGSLDELPPVKTEVELANITQNQWRPLHTSLPTLADRGVSVEQFRSLRSHIYQARYEAPLKTILVASGLPSEGKSFIAANLAISLARNSTQNILLIDGDLRRPTLHDLLGTPNELGLSNYLEDTASLREVMQCNNRPEGTDDAGSEAAPNLTFIPSGSVCDHSSELVANGRMEELIAAVSPYFDWIVIDAPPVLAVTDAVDLARAADAVLLVARGASTPYEVAQRTKVAFGNARILGFVLNAVNDAPRNGTYNYYYNAAPEASGRSKRHKVNGR